MSKSPRQSFLFFRQKIWRFTPLWQKCGWIQQQHHYSESSTIGNKPETQCKSSLWAQQASTPPTIFPRAPPPRSQDLPEMEKRLWRFGQCTKERGFFRENLPSSTNRSSMFMSFDHPVSFILAAFLGRPSDKSRQPFSLPDI